MTRSNAPSTRVNGTYLDLKSADSCRYDGVALGEVMLRLDPGESRIRQARRFDVWVGGGEYNVAAGLSATFDRRCALCSALVRNDVGRLIERSVRADAVDTKHVIWRSSDGIGQTVRNGINFTERGYGLRAGQSVSDRGHSAASQLGPEDVDWDKLFGGVGVRWFHTGGIFASLSNTTRATAFAAMDAARRHGTVVSYDLNFRASLWRERGGFSGALGLDAEAARHADVLIGGDAHLAAVLSEAQPSSPVDLAAILHRASESGPFPRIVAGTRRRVTSASRHSWRGFAWTQETGLIETAPREDIDVLDRIGSGDAFLAGFIHGILEGWNLRAAVECGIAHGILTMTTPGDTPMTDADEVNAVSLEGTLDVRR